MQKDHYKEVVKKKENNEIYKPKRYPMLKVNAARRELDVLA